MSEDRGPDSLDAHVRRLMKDLGLWGYHPLNSIGSRQGWPDWTILGAWIMHRELKRQSGKLTADQQMVGDLIQAAKGDWDVWRPVDLLSGRIARELAALAGIAGAG
jgi:hypothetical protein